MTRPATDAAAPDDVTPSYEGRDLEALSGLPNYYAWIADLLTPGLSGRTLEIGAGIGANADWALAKTTGMDLVEPSENLVPRLQERHGDKPGVTVTGATLEDFTPSVADASYDTILLVNVLEHIEDDAAALAEFYRMLKPGGHLLLYVPALSFLFSPLDRLVGHYRRYHKPAMTALVRQAGFEIARATYCDMLGILPWYLVNRLMGATEINPAMAKLYDSVGVPVTRFVESLVPAPAGKNIALIARKPVTV
ncbi:MAG: class I SAM-dependent methyltransferase [Rhodospirillales bacterium]